MDWADVVMILVMVVAAAHLARMRMMVVVTQMQPQNTQTRVASQEGRREGVKQVVGRRCSVRQVCISPSRVSPPTWVRLGCVEYWCATSVTIQSGMARAATAKMSAARKSAPEIRLSLSILAKLPHDNFSQPLSLCLLSFYSPQVLFLNYASTWIPLSC